MDIQELCWENTYKNLSNEERAGVLKLIHGYIFGLKFPANYEVNGAVLTVFMGFIESLRN